MSVVVHYWEYPKAEIKVGGVCGHINSHIKVKQTVKVYEVNFFEEAWGNTDAHNSMCNHVQLSLCHQTNNFSFRHIIGRP